MLGSLLRKTTPLSSPLLPRRSPEAHRFDSPPPLLESADALFWLALLQALLGALLVLLQAYWSLFAGGPGTWTAPTLDLTQSAGLSLVGTVTLRLLALTAARPFDAGPSLPPAAALLQLVWAATEAVSGAYHRAALPPAGPPPRAPPLQPLLAAGPARAAAMVSLAGLVAMISAARRRHLRDAGDGQRVHPHPLAADGSSYAPSSSSSGRRSGSGSPPSAPASPDHGGHHHSGHGGGGYGSPPRHHRSGVTASVHLVEFTMDDNESVLFVHKQLRPIRTKPAPYYTYKPGAFAAAAAAAPAAARPAAGASKSSRGSSGGSAVSVGPVGSY